MYNFRLYMYMYVPYIVHIFSQKRGIMSSMRLGGRDFPSLVRSGKSINFVSSFKPINNYFSSYLLTLDVRVPGINA